MKSNVWYASYGSNLLRSRFMCYIQGGRPEGASQMYTGCTDKTPPKEDRTITIPNELYFSQHSSIWQDKGVAFIKSIRDENVKTLGRMYLINSEQFTEVVRQENGCVPADTSININFNELLSSGETTIPPSWYARIILLGHEDDFPVLTFTAGWDDSELIPEAPGENYLKIICRGLREAYNISEKELIDYFRMKAGIKDNIQENELIDIIRGSY